MMDMKEELAKRAEKKEVTLKKGMTIADSIRAMETEIKKALPSFISAERFTRMALSALNTTPKLAECTQMSFLSALMCAAQLGLEPNTPLGQAYLIPFKNKGVMECQFQIGYKGLLDLAYRNEMLQTVQAHIVYEKDRFSYELGLNAELKHIPALCDRGEMVAVYAYFKLNNGGFGFEVLSKEEVELHAQRYSQSYNASISPWKSNFSDMAKKTAVKRVLKYAPLKIEVLQALSTDESIKYSLAEDMSMVQNEEIIVDMEEESVA